MEPNNTGSLLFHATSASWRNFTCAAVAAGGRATHRPPVCLTISRSSLFVFHVFDGAIAACQERSDKRRQERELGCVRFHHHDFRDERKSFERESLYCFLHACTRISFLRFVATGHGEETSGKRFLHSTPE